MLAVRFWIYSECTFELPVEIFIWLPSGSFRSCKQLSVWVLHWCECCGWPELWIMFLTAASRSASSCSLRSSSTSLPSRDGNEGPQSFHNHGEGPSWLKAPTSAFTFHPSTRSSEVLELKASATIHLLLLVHTLCKHERFVECDFLNCEALLWLADWDSWACSVGP